MDAHESVPPVRKSVDVPVSAERAFAAFTGRPTDWWPESHVLVAAREAVVFEPRVGGRWYERAADGSERDWGRVLTWEPPRRIALSWRVDGDFRPIDDDERASRVVVTFTSRGPESTSVELAHVELDRHGPAARGIRAAIEGPSPGETLARFAAAVAPRTTPRNSPHNGLGGTADA
ncbi:SRPBCC family protein [Actinomadura rubrisoli]|uniref:ATPase n=1 Tax=Actinomadura rubrisoli TaxID=2530368 RepID=A0A4R5BMH5_9ACTN|nr:SRPBCC family protein [Actinomadura rubrisoli]TDD88008.1 ATPase [Actinomadura rubrisoli]